MRTPPDQVETRRDAVIGGAIELFRTTFAGRPAAVAVAPARVNLIGDHTDYEGGLALPMTIDRWTAVAAGRSVAPESRAVTSLERCGPAACDLTASDAPERVERLEPHWARYVFGSALELRAAAGGDAPAPRVDLAVSGDVPVGSGVSSSASLEVAVAGAVNALLEYGVSRADLPGVCQRAEHRFAGVPCGLMDQYTAVHGESGAALLIDCARAEHRLIPIPRDDDAIGLLVDTKVPRALNAGDYAARRALCRRAAAALGVQTLGGASEERLLAVRSRLSEEEFRAARHVVRENARVRRVADLLLTAAERQIEDWEPVLEEIGVLMVQSHRSLRDDMGVSCPELECVVDAALDGDGAYGARLTGAGFGGCALVLCDPSWAERVARRVEQEFERRFDYRCGVTSFRSVDGLSTTADH
ncbi:MAG: galactokinase [Phycisphaerae bacterium]|nr:galactokinase [Phycisphaerae bacterium]